MLFDTVKIMIDVEIEDSVYLNDKEQDKKVVYDPVQIFYLLKSDK